MYKQAMNGKVDAGTGAIPVGPSIPLWLYVGLTTTLFVIWGASFGGGLWQQEGYWGMQWQHLMFEGMCHQIPDRSFWIGGQPMAVCARCLGVYTALFLFAAVVPWIQAASRLSDRYLRTFLVGVLAANAMDVLASISGLWQNIPITRFVLGSGIGGLAILYLINKTSDHGYK